MAQSALEACNAALIKLGEKTITSLSDDVRSAQILNARYDNVKKSLLRMHPWNFACKRVNLEPTWASITGAVSDGSADNEIRITSATHGLSDGNRVTIRSVGGTTEADGTWIINDKTTNTFDLVDSTFTNTYTSGGEWALAATYGYAYSIALPSDCIRVLRVNDYMLKPEWRIEGQRLLTDEDAVELKYIYDVTDYTTMPIDFYECLALYLAIDVCLPLTQSDERKNQLQQEFQRMLSKARHSDATEDSAEELEANDWIASRYSSPTYRGFTGL